MARQTRAQAESPDTGYYIQKLLATLVSATNADGTPYSLPVSPPTPVAADILAGRQAFTATTAATTLITVPAGRTWVGEVGASCASSVAAANATAGQALAEISTAGTGVTPAAGVYFGVDALQGANSATGTVGGGAANFGSMPLVVIAPVGNGVTVQAACTIAGTGGRVAAYASGALVAQ